VVVFLVAVLGSLLVIFLWFVDSHNLNVKYYLWKNDLYDLPSNSTLRFQYLNVDVKFRKSLIGMSYDQFKKFYPDTEPFETTKDNRTYYVNSVPTPSDWHWLGKSSWAICVIHNRVVAVELFKG
jgi:hypothetical protein